MREHLCLPCFETLPFIASMSDSRAALEGKDFFPDEVSSVQSLFYYSKDSHVADMIHRLKYKGQYRIGRYLGELLGQRMAKSSDWQEYTIVPVPIHPKRRRSRGYNQAEEIAQGLSATLAVPLIPDYLKRIKYERSQTGKDKHDRSSILRSSFIRNLRYEGLEKIILIDDVITTGSTINACTNELIRTSSPVIAVASLGISI